MNYKQPLTILSLLISCYSVDSAFSQTVNKYDFERIEDNSFLIEEAYNQEPGVIQHISTFEYLKDKTWSYTLTDEWPVPRETHQLSATIPLLNTGATGIGDIFLNYRYQAILKPQFAFSPRFSLLLPTGNYKKGLGSGVPGYQVSFPFSLILSHKIVTHYNIGLTLIPGANNTDGSKSDLVTFNYGMSVILLVNKNFNFMLEMFGNNTSAKSVNTTKNTGSLILNPGFRYAFNFKSGLQIVPGMAFPVGIGPSNGVSGIFLYLSFEHPAWKPR